jgi:PAS domain S-box-containing protein
MGNPETGRYGVFFEVSPDMLFIAGLDGRLQDVNPAAEKITGFTREQVIGSPLSDRVLPEDRPLEKEYLKDMATNGTGSTELRFACADGSVKWVSLHCAVAGGLVHGVARDITRRNTAEAAMRESEALLRRILDKAPMSMAIVGMDGTIEYINRKAEETFGYAYSDIPNMDRWWAQAYPDEAYRKDVIARYMGHVYEAIEKNGEIAGEEYVAT